MHGGKVMMQKVIGWSRIWSDPAHFPHLPARNHMPAPWNMGFSTMPNTVQSMPSLAKIILMLKVRVANVANQMLPNRTPPIQLLIK